MLSLFHKLVPFIDQVRSAPNDVKSAWFNLLIAVMHSGQKRGETISAGWYQTDNGMELFQLPTTPSSQEALDPPLYRVTILPLPEIRQYNTSYLVELSQTTMTSSLFPPVPADIEIQQIEIMIHNVQNPHDSRKHILERQRHLTDPVWQQHQITDEAGQPLSFVTFAHLRGIVDTAIAASGLLPSQPTVLDRFKKDISAPPRLALPTTP